MKEFLYESGKEEEEIKIRKLPDVTTVFVTQEVFISNLQENNQNFRY